jgi:hypothetical protein
VKLISGKEKHEMLLYQLVKLDDQGEPNHVISVSTEHRQTFFTAAIGALAMAFERNMDSENHAIVEFPARWTFERWKKGKAIEVWRLRLEDVYDRFEVINPKWARALMTKRNLRALIGTVDKEIKQRTNDHEQK